MIGAGNSAGQAVLNLAGAGARVKMLVRGDALAKTMSAYLVERIAAAPADRRCATGPSSSQPTATLASTP